MASKLRNTFTEMTLLECNDSVVHYIPTQIKGMDDNQITFLCSPSALTRMDNLLNKCAEKPIRSEKYLKHIEFMEACYMTKIENRDMDIYETLRNANKDDIYSVVADSTYQGIRHLKKHSVSDISSLTKLWSVSSKSCYFDINVKDAGIRTEGSRYYFNSWNLWFEPADLLQKRLESALEFDCGHVVLNRIVRALYIMMSNPYGKGSERLALTYLEDSLPTAGIPLSMCLNADYANFDKIMEDVWVCDKFDCIDITNYVSYMINTICKAAKVFDIISDEIVTDCLKYIPEEGIKMSALKEILKEKLYNADKIIDLYLCAEYIMEYPNGYIVPIYK